MVHPNQPSPSPSQINNPAIYAAPPPTRPTPRPTTGNGQPSHPPVASAPSFPQPQISSWGKPPLYGAPSPPSGPSPSLYGSHAPYSSISSPPHTNPITNFPPTNWSTSSPASGQPQLHQPQPVTANQTTNMPLGAKSSTAAMVQGASTVVLGLMDKLKNTNRR
ncbi:hypothetical protein M413DRAFT_442478 [Hebeloma cylindrosporum]|uniref:Uncharacterized protein n=1 Tax=Hebeloma cylindrosporum TaxID=76867 RepID=A0A0C3C6K1_HEBCY|nr:hypothetical protein M413DRAFT_442478 [Hebeloma cylindrosporum h7]